MSPVLSQKHSEKPAAHRKYDDLDRGISWWLSRPECKERIVLDTLWVLHGPMERLPPVIIERIADFSMSRRELPGGVRIQ